MLWFAFILLSLSYWQQHFAVYYSRFICCDLLSFYYLCRTDNNPATSRGETLSVVICFHFTIFVVLTTTLFFFWIYRILLWFAFILLSLSYWQQQLASIGRTFGRCDLLSFYYLCRTDNNLVCIHRIISLVVICFHFTIFVVLTTTCNEAGANTISCDLLSFYYLCRTDNNK